MKKLSCLMLCGLLAGCGGDSDSSDNTNDPQGTARINGTVDSISYDDGRISVNSHELDGSSAAVEYEDNAMDFNAVTTGMVVDVTAVGTTAQIISLEPAAMGQVTAVTTSTTSVNGIEYQYPPNGLAEGDWVMVFAQMQPDGSWRVSSIDKTDAGTLAEIEGAISGLDQTNNAFTLVTVAVDYSNAVIDDNQPLQNGLWVEVFGQFVDGKFVASVVDPRDSDDFNNTELEGIVTWVSDDRTEFEIAGHIRVHVNNSTVFDDGTINSLVVGAIVDVDLQLQDDLLIAARVDFEDKLDAPDNLEFNVEGKANYQNAQLSINGINFQIDASTEFDDGISLSNLDGQWVELDGKSMGGQFVLKEIEPEREDSEISLEGPVSANTMWGYTSSDNSLAQFNDKWVDIECQRSADNDLTACRLDPN